MTGEAIAIAMSVIALMLIFFSATVVVLLDEDVDILPADRTREFLPEDDDV